jgi:hypothetical protein
VILIVYTLSVYIQWLSFLFFYSLFFSLLMFSFVLIIKFLVLYMLCFEF